MNPILPQAAVSAPAGTQAPPLFGPEGILARLMNPSNLLAGLRVIGVVVAGVIVVRVLVSLARVIGKKRLAPRTAVILEKSIGYLGFAVVAVNAFAAAGVDLTALLGAAGIVGIAVGFAAQTSIANVISGIFMLSEKSFSVGDVIEVGEVCGIVESIDMLSVKVQTFDNRLVRIPNENLIKSNLINITRYPIRRLNMEFTITHDADLELARDTLLAAAGANPFILSSPEPFFMISGFSARGTDIFFGVWFRQERLIDVKNAIYIDVKHRFDQVGIRLASQSVEMRVATGHGAKTGRKKAGQAGHVQKAR